ncbi:hypothetical protein T235_14320 [Tannerella sp. oral taxon BU063 isolate Cell 8/11]|uniref:Uncharacterized protein n=1 Tax=Tannerella sp. oral taxon BU063 isolate Cell 8/11 TaxID=1411915 RepID=W2CWU1_9BACT|nr:hypothetical protein T235_14320 [Tannerella sp. oral taxon BU063 isolate Cell 8/11]
MSTRFTLTRRYLRAHVWLHRQCDRLSPKWQKRIVFGLCIVYFVCSIAMIAQLFLPQKEGQLPITRSDQTIVDSPIKRDSLHRHVIEPIKT